MHAASRARRRSLCMVAAGAALLASSGVGAQDSPETSLALETRWAMDLHGGRSSKLELLATPELDAPLGSDARFVAIARLRADAFDRLSPGDGRREDYVAWSRPARPGHVVEVELRELYIDFRIGRTDVRAGKQQIVWGKADGLKVLDVVDPQDFREFILDDFEDSRIPLWSLNVERRLGPLSVQLLWITDPTVHEIPRPEARFAFTSPLVVPPPPPAFVPVVTSTSHPRRFLRDSDAGLRVSGSRGGWDWTLNYLYRYEDAPVFSRTLPGSLGEPVVVEIGYERSPLVGGSFSKALGDWVLRGEVATALDRRFVSTLLGDRDGVVKTTETSYVLGVDWYGVSSTFISAQLFQSTLAGHHNDELERDDTESTLTLFVRRQFRHDTWSVEVGGLRSIDHGDGLWRLRVIHAVRDDLKVSFGTDLLYGDRAGLFGEFRKADRLFLNVELRL